MLKALRKVELAIIGGSGLERLLEGVERTRVGTPYGLSNPILIGDVNGRAVAFLPRHGLEHTIPPHKVNYRANLYALRSLGVERAIATNAVGAINVDFEPGDLVIPHDFIDFTKWRYQTFYEGALVTHVDLSQPYCPEVRSILIRSAEEVRGRVWDKAVLVCTEGPRFETPAEIEAFRRLGADIVGMTGVPEAVLARELEMCYATLCYVSNMAAGLQSRLTVDEVKEVAERVSPIVERVLKNVLRSLPVERNCPCPHALRGARY